MQQAIKKPVVRAYASVEVLCGKILLINKNNNSVELSWKHRRKLCKFLNTHRLVFFR